jgi:CheY-like chemotaxis protein
MNRVSRLRAKRPGASLLIVDDDHDSREALERLLRYAGYRVVTASNGGEALEVLRGQTSLPDLILLDLMMPVMDGRAFRAAQKSDPRIAHIPVVVVSAQGDLTAALEADAYLDKPLELTSLVDTIERVTGATEAEGTATEPLGGERTAV